MYYNIEPTKNQELISKTLSEIRKRKPQQKIFVGKLSKAIKESKKISKNTVKNVENCATYISFDVNGKIYGANFCKHRYCPICQWRRSKQVYAEISEMQRYIEAEKEYEYIFITLTILNTKTLEEGLDIIFPAWHRFINQRKARRAIKGYIRTLEITYNKIKQTWHPHIHMIAAVAKNYFTSNDYISKDELRTMWTQALNARYFVQVDIRKVQATDPQAIAEIAKYAVKPMDIMSEKSKQETINELIKGTFHRRLRSFGGIYKETAKKLKINENQTNLTDTDATIPNQSYVYVRGQYVPADNLTENERYEATQNCNKKENVSLEKESEVIA